MRNTFCGFLLMFLLHATLSHAAENVYVEYLNNLNGLPNNTVRGIFQDSKGFIWMSTLNGISRYDGYSFTNFSPQSGEKVSLADRRVKTIGEDSKGHLWFTTSADIVSCFDLAKDCFVDFTGCGEHMQNYGYYHIYPNEVWLWGRHNGCRRVTCKNGVFHSEAFSTRNGKLKSDYVNFVHKAYNGEMWIGTKRGLYKYSAGRLSMVSATEGVVIARSLSDKRLCFLTGDWKVLIWDGKRLSQVADLRIRLGSDALTGAILLKGELMAFTSSRTVAIDTRTFQYREVSGVLNIPKAQSFVDAKGLYWLYNQRGRLYVVSPNKGLLKMFDTTPAYQARLIGNERYRVSYDTNGVAWIISNISGLYSYDFHTNKFVHHGEKDGRKPLVTSDAVQSFLIDRSGGYWVGSEYTGVSHFRFVENNVSTFYVNPSKVDVPEVNNIRLTFRLRDGNILIGTKDGQLYTYNASLTRLLRKESVEQNIYAVSQDKKGTIWKASRGAGLFVGDRQYKSSKSDSSALSYNQLFCLLNDSKDRNWIGSFGRGLNLAVPDGKGGYRFRHFFNETYAQSNIRVLMQDSNGWIWVGTGDGLFLFNPEVFLRNGRSRHYLPGYDIKQIVEDSKGNVFLAESGVGVAVSRKGRDYGNIEFEQFGTESGLVNSTVQALVEDSQGRMWLTTENGVSCFNLSRRIFDNYFFSNDMSHNIYNESAALRLDDGRLAFGSNYGLVLIDPARLKGQPETSTVVFTDFKLNGISGKGDDSPLKEALPYSSSLRLAYNQNSFIVNFSTLDYPISTLPQYSYLLENYDKEWSVPSTLNFAGYKNLSPGKYKLRVKVRNAGGLWSKESVLEVVVQPPFWLTPWAYFVYIVLISTAICFAFKIIKQMTDLRNKVKIEKQLTDYKLVFFTNISHEFRTPLTLILAGIDRLSHTPMSPELSSSVKLMTKSANRLMRLVNQLMDFRKMEKNKLRLALEQADVVAFVKGIVQNFNDRAAQKEMDFTFVPNVPSYTMFIDREKLDKIVFNLLSNAFKYTPSRGHIVCRLTVNESQNDMTLCVEDSGVGIPKDKQKELFGRFMQSNFSSESMGIGLHLTKELVTVLKGTISYSDNPAGGAQFTVVLPTDKTKYEKGDFLTASSALLKEEDQQRKSISEIEAEADITMTMESRESMPDSPLNKKNLLVIEDDDDIRMLLKNELSPYFNVEVKADGETGVDYAVNNDVDLIVCDVMMPGMSGFDVTRKLKNEFSTSHIPIILLTALGDADNYLEGIERGADAYVTKPFSVRLLLARISKLIEQRDKLKEKFSKDPISLRPIICTTDKEKQFADRLVEIINEQLKNSDFSADDFAAAMALGRTVFYKKVKGVTGYSPKEYIRIIRLKKAAQLLLNPDVTVSEVTYEVGMNDPFYFSRCFKAQFGVSPSAYQKSGGKFDDVVAKDGNSSE